MTSAAGNTASVHTVLKKCGVTFYQIVGVARNTDAIVINNAIAEQKEMIRNADVLHELEKGHLARLMDAAWEVLLTKSEKEAYDKTLPKGPELATPYRQLLQQLARANFYQYHFLAHTRSIDAVDHEYGGVRREMDQMYKDQQEGVGFSITGKKLIKLRRRRTILEDQARKLESECKMFAVHLGPALNAVKQGPRNSYCPQEAPLSSFEMRWADLDAAMGQEAVTSISKVEMEVDRPVAQPSVLQTKPRQPIGLEEQAVKEVSCIHAKTVDSDAEQKTTVKDNVMSGESASQEIVMSKDGATMDIQMPKDVAPIPEVTISEGSTIPNTAKTEKPAVPETLHAEEVVSTECPAVTKDLKRGRGVADETKAPAKRCRLDDSSQEPPKNRKNFPRLPSQNKRRGSDLDTANTSNSLNLKMKELWDGMLWNFLEAPPLQTSAACGTASTSKPSRKRSSSDWEDFEESLKKAKTDGGQIPTAAEDGVHKFEFSDVAPITGKRTRDNIEIETDGASTAFRESKKCKMRKMTTREKDATVFYKIDVTGKSKYFDSEEIVAYFAAVAAGSRGKCHNSSNKFNLRQKGCTISSCASASLGRERPTGRIRC